MISNLDHSLINETIMSAREIEINNLAIEVEQVSDIFNDLSILVQNQGHCIDNIETNIINSENNIEQANIQITKINNYRKTKRRYMCKCIIFVIILVIIIIIILYVKIK